MDTNVVLPALRSHRRSFFLLLMLVVLMLVGQSNLFEINLLVPLVLEDEDVAKRPGLVSALSAQDSDDILDYLCSVARRNSIFFLWRPFLKDPKDNMVWNWLLKRSANIVTFNLCGMSIPRRLRRHLI